MEMRDKDRGASCAAYAAVLEKSATANVASSERFLSRGRFGVVKVGDTVPPLVSQPAHLRTLDKARIVPIAQSQVGIRSGGPQRNWGLDHLNRYCNFEKATTLFRSEERRVGKECRSRWSP